MDPTAHQHCAATIKEDMTRRGVDVEVTVRLPQTISSLVRRFDCEHGITYWVHPSEGQLEEWRRIGMNP